MDRSAADSYLSASTRGILITNRKDGRSQSSNIAYTYRDGVVRISLTTSRAKTKNLLRDPRALLHVTSSDEWYQYVVADGSVEITPPATDTTDATADELCEVFEAITGQAHPDWEEFRQAMVDEGRVVARLTVEHVYGQLNG